MQQLPRLETKIKEPCSVKVYEGVEGLRSALFSFVNGLSNNSIIELYGANDDKKRDAVLAWPKYREIAKKKNLRTRVILTHVTAAGRAIRKKRNFGNYDKEYRFFTGTDLASFMVCQHRVLLFNFKVPNCIVIENSAYAQQFKELFAALWKSGETL